MVDPTVAEFDDSASGDDLRELSRAPRLKLLQTSTPVRDAVWTLVNEHVCAARPDVKVRGLRHVGVVGTLPGLQNLLLQDLPHVVSLPGLAGSRALRRIVLQHLEGLHDFSALESAPALEEFALIDGRRQTPRQLVPVLNNPRVRRVSAGFGSDRRNREFVELRAQYGKAEFYAGEPFEYR